MNSFSHCSALWPKLKRQKDRWTARQTGSERQSADFESKNFLSVKRWPDLSSLGGGRVTQTITTQQKSQSNSSIDLKKVLGLNNRQGCFNQSINALSVSPLFPRNSGVCLALMSLTEAEKDACSSASKGQ